jgi:hypothetical protein
LIDCDRASLDAISSVAKAMRAECRYLHIPVRSGDPMRRVRLSVCQTVLRWFDIELAEGEPDWWASIDLTPFRGESVIVALEGEGPATDLDTVHQSDEIVGSDGLYREARRPRLTFSSRRGSRIPSSAGALIRDRLRVSGVGSRLHRPSWAV